MYGRSAYALTMLKRAGTHATTYGLGLATGKAKARLPWNGVGKGLGIGIINWL
jgi:hypothetical protein